MFFDRFFGFGESIGIDLGTATVLVFIKGKGIVLREPSVVTIDKNTNTILAVGEEAREMIGKTPGNIVAVRPLKEGVISDYETTERMLKYFIQKAMGSHPLAKPTIAVCVPSSITEVERRAVEDATRQAGARKVHIIEEPIAAAIGAGIDISKACGSMVVDIGGGTTDIAVISLGGNVVSTSLKMAGDNFDEAIIRHMRKKHNLLIGERSAEALKINIGTAYERTMPVSMDIRGRNLITGLPRNITVTSDEMLEALSEPVNLIADAVHSILEKTPPELAADIADRGIVMTGGGSLLYGLDKLIEERTGINTIIADDAVSCVAMGTGQFIEFEEGYMRSRGRADRRRNEEQYSASADITEKKARSQKASR
ncbi:rod shape-determining protein MreB [Lachnospiraceae bacterium NSJ-143]|nr:rod shape-determining protein MreB [Lachnospiraceae bacterium NSJ-143]